MDDGEFLLPLKNNKPYESLSTELNVILNHLNSDPIKNEDKQRLLAK